MPAKPALSLFLACAKISKGRLKRKETHQATSPDYNQLIYWIYVDIFEVGKLRVKVLVPNQYWISGDENLTKSGKCQV
jgi:hypothetical protein